MAIGIITSRMTAESDPKKSKFFGDPLVPAEWATTDWGEQIFFCQIDLADIAASDVDRRLPHNGWLYVFLDTATYPYIPVVRYYDGDPNTVLDGFNDFDDDFEALTEPREMTFEHVPDDMDGTRLFGVPSDWNYAEEPPALFMQFDPMSDDSGFMDDVDGYVYLFYGKDGATDSIYMHVERS